MDGWMTVGQAARALRLQPVTVRGQITKGRILAERAGRDWLIPRDEVERYRREIRREQTA